MAGKPAQERQPHQLALTNPANGETRLEFIEFRLFWEGVLNRADIIDYFGVSVPQASNDLSRYQELAPPQHSLRPQRKGCVATNRHTDFSATSSGPSPITCWSPRRRGWQP
jgi:hypothetical protein